MDGMFPRDWYWLADDERLYSSARQMLVGQSDADYDAWLKTGRISTRWPVDDSGQQTKKSLLDVISLYGLICATGASDALQQLKISLKSNVDQSAETERLKYITPGAGQAMTYQQKADEAGRYLAASAPNASDYPLLSAEVGITAADISGVAQVIAAAFARWQAIGGAIEAVRLAAKKAIDDATTVDAANAAANVTWPTPAS